MVSFKPLLVPLAEAGTAAVDITGDARPGPVRELLVEARISPLGLDARSWMGCISTGVGAPLLGVADRSETDFVSAASETTLGLGTRSYVVGASMGGENSVD